MPFQLNIFLKPVHKSANGFEDFCVQIRKQLSCEMKDLQLSVNNVDQCSSIFNHKDFSHAASLDLNFQTYTPIHTADLKIPSHQPCVNWKFLVPSYRFDTLSPNPFKPVI